MLSIRRWKKKAEKFTAGVENFGANIQCGGTTAMSAVRCSGRQSRSGLSQSLVS